MKSEKVIREHRDILLLAMKLPCGCAGTRHALKCIVGLRMMQATADTLSWALGENEEMGELVENMAHDVKARSM